MPDLRTIATHHDFPSLVPSTRCHCRAQFQCFASRSQFSHHLTSFHSPTRFTFQLGFGTARGPFKVGHFLLLFSTVSLRVEEGLANPTLAALAVETYRSARLCDDSVYSYLLSKDATPWSRVPWSLLAALVLVGALERWRGRSSAALFLSYLTAVALEHVGGLLGVLAGVRGVGLWRSWRGYPTLVVGGRARGRRRLSRDDGQEGVAAPNVLAAAILASFPYLLLGESCAF